MRTTVTLDSDVERILREETHRTGKSFKEILNLAVRKALKPKPTSLPKLLPPLRMGVMPGIDPSRISRLADDLEAEEYRSLTSLRQKGSSR